MLDHATYSFAQVLCVPAEGRFSWGSVLLKLLHCLPESFLHHGEDLLVIFPCSSPSLLTFTGFTASLVNVCRITVSESLEVVHALSQTKTSVVRSTYKSCKIRRAFLSYFCWSTYSANKWQNILFQSLTEVAKFKQGGNIVLMFLVWFF